VLQVAGENDDGERTQTKIVAEIQEVNSARPLLDPDYLPGNAFDCAHMFPGLRKGNAVGTNQAVQQQHEREWPQHQ
jgi:hypothetical protein